MTWSLQDLEQGKAEHPDRDPEIRVHEPSLLERLCRCTPHGAAVDRPDVRSWITGLRAHGPCPAGVLCRNFTVHVNGR